MPSYDIKILVVDNSVSTCQVLTALLDRQEGMRVVGAARDVYDAKDLIIRTDPDVLLLDIDMTQMDGITFLNLLMKHRPMPVIILSHQTKSGANEAIECANAGAAEVIAKPNCDYQLTALGDEIARKVRAAVEVDPRPTPPLATRNPPLTSCGAATYDPRQLILLGASTGGTDALNCILDELPADLPGVLIVQHIPPEFSRAFAERLNRSSALEVSEAQDGDIAKPGTAFVAPGDHHMEVEWTGKEYKIRLNQDPPIFHQRPSVDKLFNSAARSCGSQAVAALLTGMGKDGAKGLLNLKNARARTIAQDRKTSAIYGMPRAAVEAGAVCQQLPLEEIAAALIDNSRMSRDIARVC